MKYMGSKARIAKYISGIIQKEIDKGRPYVELFCGGCNFLTHIKGRIIANDNNIYLIEMWKSLCNGVQFPKTIERGFYNDVRASYNNKDNRYGKDLIGWVGFMGSFNGRFFDGGYSGHDVNGRDYIREQINNTLSQICELKGVEWFSKDYKDVRLPSGSVIYCDIPYKGTKQYSTSKYFDYDYFYSWCREMKEKGHKVFISEYDMPEDFICVWEKEVTNSMNQTKTKKPIEKLFTI